MKTFYIETFGCQMNVHDSEKVIGTLLNEGYQEVGTPDDAGLVLYNTCSVRDKAERKVYSRLQQFQRAKGNGKAFAVIGCVAQQEGERIFERAPHVGLVCGSASYNHLPELLGKLEAGERRVTGLDLDVTDTFETPYTQRRSSYQAFLTIIEGCDKACAYCVVPRTRGPERSRTSASVIEEVNRLVDAGFTELTLLGQNVNSYQDPSPAGWDFATLLARVGEVSGLRRVRFTTSHPRDFVREIIDAIDSNETLCNHVHLPVQSGSSAVLRRMQRLYDREHYLQCIDWVKSAPPIALTTDIIVGFPGETEAEFLDTVSLIEQVQYDSMFSFKYSPRPETPALALDLQVPEEEKGHRLSALLEKQRSIQIRRNSLLIGSTAEVLVERFNNRTGQWAGHTAENRTLNFTHAGLQENESLLGTYVLARVTRSGPNSLVGEAIVS